MTIPYFEDLIGLVDGHSGLLPRALGSKANQTLQREICLYYDYAIEK